MKRSVLQVIDKLDVGGAERVLVDMSILLSKHSGCSITVLCLLGASELDNELKDHDINIIYLERPSKYHFGSFIRLLKILNQFDIIHVHSRHVLRYIGLTHFIPYFFKKYKIIFHDHYGNIETNDSLENHLRFCVRKSNAYIGVSKRLVYWANANRLNKSIYLLSNIIREQSAKNKSVITNQIILVGNFRPQKNYEFIIELMIELPDNIKVDIYGQIVDKVYYEFITKLINENNLNERIQIITDIKNVTPLLNNYKLALHCAHSETGPLVAIEYLQKELPFLMYDTGEVANAVKSVTNSIVINSFDLIEWKLGIVTLLEDSKLRSDTIRDMRLIYKTHFSEENYVKRCLEIYQNIKNY